MDKKSTYQSILFFLIGLGLIWFVFRGTNIEQLKNELYRISWFWVGISVVLNLLSLLVRAYRWKTLFIPLNYSPKIYNLFLAMLILVFTNQIIPRGGEVARLGIVNKYEKVPLSKLFGIALIERLTDLIILILIFIVLLIWQFPLIQKIIELPQINLLDVSIHRILIISGIIIISLVILYFIIRKFKNKIKKIKQELREGFTSIYYIKNKFLYLIQSILIYGIWLFMLYVLFLAYPPTQNLSIETAVFTFGIAAIAFLLPIQAGMGAWHFVVIQCLLLFGVGVDDGKVFALIAHSVTNHVYLITGIIALALLPIVNYKKVNPDKLFEIGKNVTTQVINRFNSIESNIK
ncbi:MAG: flippase-like domain-containing protein [Bacteroidales bacterium]|nr:flippase-like domain-containing protein [Bacteroidales bacterium]